MKKADKENGAALIGIELSKKEDFHPLIKKLDEYGFDYKTLETDDMLYKYLI